MRTFCVCSTIVMLLAGCAVQQQNPGQTAQPKELPRSIIGRDGAKMVLIPAGEFEMGSPPGEFPAGIYVFPGVEPVSDEHPRHTVYLDAYYIDVTEVTVAQYRKFCEATKREMPDSPPWGWRDDHPIVNVSWGDANAYAGYCGKRLPSEAEWEKACRAGSTTKYCFGDEQAAFGEYAWYCDNSDDHVHPVGTKKPNALGLHDMYGNVREWCADWYGELYYRSSPKGNPTGPTQEAWRVQRGGHFCIGPPFCRSAARDKAPPYERLNNGGFRCALSATK